MDAAMDGGVRDEDVESCASPTGTEWRIDVRELGGRWRSAAAL